MNKISKYMYLSHKIASCQCQTQVNVNQNKQMSAAKRSGSKIILFYFKSVFSGTYGQ